MGKAGELLAKEKFIFKGRIKKKKKGQKGSTWHFLVNWIL